MKRQLIQLSLAVCALCCAACSSDDSSDGGYKPGAETGAYSRPHSIDTYTESELIYMAAVAEDLRNQAVRLEAAWAGMEQVDEEKQAILEEAELETPRNYGAEMLQADRSLFYKTYQAAAEQALQGCIDIADEVATQKMGRPHLAASQSDRNYIESPYALNSLADFADNIRSIQMVYEGNGGASLSDFIKLTNSALDKQVRSAIRTAIARIGDVPEPFARTATGQATQTAIEAVEDLSDLLTRAQAELSKDVENKEALLKAAIAPYITQTVVPTYRSMASHSMEVARLCAVMLDKYRAGTLSKEDVVQTGEAWTLARHYWELSEAFLFGAAADYNIDPHIDSWPLDKAAMDATLSSSAIMAQMSADYVAQHLGYGLLGFHALEYLLYELYD